MGVIQRGSGQERELTPLEKDATNRGKDIEKMIRIIRDFAGLLPEQFKREIKPIITEYVKRNSSKSTYRKVKDEFNWL